jgi:DNA (cytosine-5)-methyltransferase 1
MKRTPTAISLFSGAGGLDYGFEAAGFEVAAAVELDHDSCETFRRHSSAVVIERTVFDVPTEELLTEAGTKKGEADILIAGPPCQPFSKSGYWARGEAARLEDPRAKTLDAFIRIMAEALPKVVFLENVEGLDYAGKNEGLQYLLSRIEAINEKEGTAYQPVFRVLNAAEFGVPQFRSRFFLIAARDGASFRFPEPTHGEESNGQVVFDREAYRTAWDAIGDLANKEGDEDLAVKGKWASLLPSVPEGQNYLWHTERGGGQPLFGWRRRFWNFLLKLSKNTPSWTIQAQPGPATGPFHWKSRRLSMRELCRLQTFPDRVEIFGNRGSVQRQVGNAVPSLLTEVLGREIGRQLLLDCAIKDGPLKLLPPVRRPVPPPEVVAPVPDHYLHLAGKHDPHPGTGRGYGAERRAAAG